MPTKLCTKCGKTLPVERFDIKDKKRGYRRSWCHECERERSRQYRETNREQINAQKRQHYKANKAQIRQSQNEYRRKNKKKISEQRHRHYVENRVAILEYQAEWRNANRDHIKQYNTRYYDEHRDSILAENKRKRKENRRYKKLSLDKRKQLFEENKGLVRHIAKRYKCHKSMYEDMLQAGYEGLWRGIVELDKFKPLRSKLSTWLGWYIQRELGKFTYEAANNSGLSAGAMAVKNAMKRNERDRVTSGREEDIRLFSTAQSIDAPIKNATDNSKTDFSNLIGEEEKFYDGISEAVRKLILCLDDLHRDVIVHRFGIGCEPQSLKVIGRRYCKTPETISNYVNEALEQLRDMPGTSSLAAYL